jgi:glycine cleavage system H protein
VRAWKLAAFWTGWSEWAGDPPSLPIGVYLCSSVVFNSAAWNGARGDARPPGQIYAAKRFPFRAQFCFAHAVDSASETLQYKRSHFVTQLPVRHLYTPAHAWLSLQEDGTWRVGLTRFATRMLGEIVDFGLNPRPDTPVNAGDVVGWIEGFKAISDLYCPGEGAFREGNPQLREQISLIAREPYKGGWIYAFTGKPDARCIDVHAYRQILDETIDRILAKQKTDEPE